MCMTFDMAIPFLGIYPKETVSDLDLSASMLDQRLCSWSEKRERQRERRRRRKGGGDKKQNSAPSKSQELRDGLSKHARSMRKNTKQPLKVTGNMC